MVIVNLGKRIIKIDYYINIFGKGINLSLLNYREKYMK